MSVVVPRHELGSVERPLSRERAVDLVVSWQHPVTRATLPIGLLRQEVDGYSFRYLRRAREIQNFRGLLGFPDFKRLYRSTELFPLFAQRAMDEDRSDYPEYLLRLGLAEGATPWEQIVRSAGDSAADTVKVSPVPERIDGAWYCVSAVTGIKYLAAKPVAHQGGTFGPLGDDQLEVILGALKIGVRVRLAHEIGNTYSSAATLVTTDDGTPFGYLPDWLAHMVRDFISEDASAAIVDDIQCHDGKWVVRVLIRLDGRVGGSLETLLGPDWETYAE
ncbi:hypothetical protein [uncultured Amnibacterium sp.]|uniref:hypothetical protein n=1 Tax=uncultured Amnibacterium sp. TaxID=1631851 RepID=UPI0035CAE4A8